MNARREPDARTVAVQASLVAAVLVGCGVLFWDDQPDPSPADGPAQVNQVAMRSRAELGQVPAEQMLGSWTVNNAHGVYQYTFEADGTWSVTQGEQDTPIASGDFTVDEQSQLRFTASADYLCRGTTATYDMTRPDHRTLAGEVIRDNCEFCFFRGTSLVLHRS